MTIEHCFEKPSVATLVATSDDLLVGFTHIPSSRGGGIWRHHRSRCARTPGRGIGGELLASAMCFLRRAAAVNARGVQLHVAEGNINARRLFAEHGYLEVGSDGRSPWRSRLTVREQYLPDGEPSTLT